MKILFLILLIGVCLATPQFIYLNNMEDNNFSDIITKNNFREFKDYFNKKYTDYNEELYIVIHMYFLSNTYIICI